MGPGIHNCRWWLLIIFIYSGWVRVYSCEFFIPIIVRRMRNNSRRWQSRGFWWHHSDVLIGLLRYRFKFRIWLNYFIFRGISDYNCWLGGISNVRGRRSGSVWRRNSYDLSLAWFLMHVGVIRGVNNFRILTVRISVWKWPDNGWIMRGISRVRNSKLICIRFIVFGFKTKTCSLGWFERNWHYIINLMKGTESICMISHWRRRRLRGFSDRTIRYIILSRNVDTDRSLSRWGRFNGGLKWKFVCIWRRLSKLWYLSTVV